MKNSLFCSTNIQIEQDATSHSPQNADLIVKKKKKKQFTHNFLFILRNVLVQVLITQGTNHKGTL